MRPIPLIPIRIGASLFDAELRSPYSPVGETRGTSAEAKEPLLPGRQETKTPSSAGFTGLYGSKDLRVSLGAPRGKGVHKHSSGRSFLYEMCFPSDVPSVSDVRQYDHYGDEGACTCIKYEAPRCLVTILQLPRYW